MSGSSSAPIGVDPAADASSLHHIRALFQRKMIDRARTLAEARWPGSGEMVTLASDWASLSPAQRRERLSSIGPEDLARLRALADLNPDLARVLDDLEKRGVLPPALFSATPGTTTEDALVDTALNLGETAAREAAARLDATPSATTVAGATALGTSPREYVNLEPLPQSQLPVLDLGLPSTDEFLSEEAERRIAETAAAHVILDRARQRVDQRADRLFRMATPSTQPATKPSIDPTILGEVDMDAPSSDLTGVYEKEQVVSSATRALAQRLRDEQVVVLTDEDATAPLDLRAIATQLHLPVMEFTLIAGEMRAAFGGLRRHGPEYVIDIGPLPKALASPSLVVIRGTVYPSMLKRWRAGFCDLPGTRVSTPIADECRILVLADT